MPIKISINDVTSALEANNISIIERKDVQNGVQIKLATATITLYRNGNAQVQGAEKEAIEDILHAKVYGVPGISNIVTRNSIAEGKQSSNVFSLPVISTSTDHRKEVFIVHGHDRTTLLELQNFLYRNNYRPIVLSEENDGGDTIIEKLERVFGPDHNIAAAIVLATPDDKYNNGTVARCRPNVELELGFVIARLTRRKLVYLRTNVLEGVNFILPSDVQGVIYQPFISLESVKHKILQELQHITTA